MSKLSDYIKTLKENDKKWFFGECENYSNNYFTFKHDIDNDNIIIITNNIVFTDKAPVLVVGNNKAVYLKDWQLKPVRNYYEGICGYAVKLNRNYFKVYTFNSNFENFSFDKEDDFDTLLEIAKQQNDVKIAIGH